MTKLNYVATLIGLLIVVVIILPTYLIGLGYVVILSCIGLAVFGIVALVSLCLLIADFLVGDDE